MTNPGFLGTILTSRSVNIDLSALKTIVYDEADELFLQTSNHKVYVELNKHLEKLKVTPQHCLYSATFTDEVIQKVKQYVGKFDAFPIKPENLKLKGVKQLKMRVSPAEKLDFIAKLHTSLDKAMTMVFLNKKDSTIKLQDRLLKSGIKAKILIGGLDNADRDKIIDDFRKNEFTTLISTNVLARGIDVPEVDLVINYDVPVISREGGWKDPDYANYQHRVGRTGRFGTDGLALTLICAENDDEFMNLI